MEKKINYALVGLFVIALGATWVAISLWLVLGEISKQYNTYHVYMNESVSGLYLDAPVKYRGVEIGKVRDISLNPDDLGQVKLELGIESGVPIKEDTIAVLAVQGLTGIAFMDLTGGSLDSPLLEAKKGEKYPVIHSGPSFFTRLDTTGTELIANLNVLANRFGDLLDAEGLQTIRDILANIERVTDTFAGRQKELEQGVTDAAAILAHGAEAAKQLPPLMAQVDSTARAFEEMAGRVNEASGNINRYVLGSGTGVQDFSQQTLPELGALISELRRLAKTLNTIGQKLGEDPRILLYGRELETPGPGE